MPHSMSADFGDFREEYGVGSLERLESFPKFIQIETVSGCNARCRMCSVHDWKRNKSAMSEALFRKLLTELGAHHDWVEQVTLQMGGEPLLDRRLEERVAALKQAGIRSVAFTTNASLLDEARAQRLLDAGIDMIDFSIDGASAATFEGIRVNLSYEEVRANVLRFVALRDASGRRVQVRVRMVIQRENAHKLDAFVDYWRNRLGPEDSVLGRFLNWWAGWRDDLDAVPGTLLHEKPPAVEINSMPCLAPFSTLVVLSDGRVPLCCLDYNADTPRGSVAELSIADVWRGEVFHRVRMEHRTGGRAAMPFCHDCHIFATGSGFDFPGIRHTSITAPDLIEVRVSMLKLSRVNSSMTVSIFKRCPFAHQSCTKSYFGDKYSIPIWRDHSSLKVAVHVKRLTDRPYDVTSRGS